MSKTLINQTAGAIYLADTGKTVPASGQYVIQLEDYETFKVSDDVVTEIGAGNLLASDGITTYGIANSVALIQGIFPATVDANITSIPRDFFHDVSMGLVAGHSTETKYGRITSIGANSKSDITPFGDQYWPTSASTVVVASSSVKDKPSSTGAHTITISGLDTNYDVLEETVTLDGTTDVTTTGSFLRVQRIKTITAGSDGHNVGTVTVEHSSNVVAQMEPEKNTTEQVTMTVPAGYMGMIYAMRMSIYSSSGTGTKEGLGELWLRPFGGLWSQGASEGMNTNGGAVSFQPSIPLNVPAKTDLRLSFSSQNNNTGATGILQLIIMEM